MFTTAALAIARVCRLRGGFAVPTTSVNHQPRERGPGEGLALPPLGICGGVAARPWVNLRRGRATLSIDHVTACAPSIPEVPLRAGAKQNVAPNTDKPPYRCRGRSDWTRVIGCLPSMCGSFSTPKITR